MEHFFIDDRFYSDLDDYINDCFPEGIDELPDDWSIRVQESKLEPMFQLTKPEVAHIVGQYIWDTHDSDLDSLVLVDNFRWIGGEVATSTDRDVVR